MAKSAGSITRGIGRRARRWAGRVGRAGSAKGRPTDAGLGSISLRRSDGTPVPVTRALNDMYIRIERIEAKLDRLLGNPITPASRAAKPTTQTYELKLPSPPAGSTATKPPGTLTMTADTSMYVPRHLGKVGFAGYEPVAMPHFLAALESVGAGAVLDIGLNVGPYALLARAFGDREVVGFEPTPDLARVARRCGVDNGLPYTVEQLALGAENGTAQLYLSDSTDSSNSLNPSFRPNSFVLEVEVETQDDYVARTGIKPALLKVDTETTEPAILTGGRNTVLTHRPWVFCEVLARQDPDELAEAIGPWGYTWYNLDGFGPLQPRDRVQGRVEQDYYMWLFAPEPLDDKYWSLVAAWAKTLAASAPA